MNHGVARWAGDFSLEAGAGPSASHRPGTALPPAPSPILPRPRLSHRRRRLCILARVTRCQEVVSIGARVQRTGARMSMERVRRDFRGVARTVLRV